MNWYSGYDRIRWYFFPVTPFWLENAEARPLLRVALKPRAMENIYKPPGT